MSVFYFVVQQTMYFSIPLLLVAVGAMYAERSGVINIALEGLMVMGAFVGIFFIHQMQEVMSGQVLLLLALLLAGLAGGVLSLFHAFASINMKADQTISGTALNMFAPAFAVYTARMLRETQQIPFTDSFFMEKIPLFGSIPVLGPMFFQKCYVTTFVGIGIFLVAAYAIRHTRFGLRLRACGEHPGAADSAGVDVAKLRYAGVLISGILAGMGGLIFVIPTSTSFQASVAGYGFLALAVLIFGQWRSGKIFLATFFFGIMKTLASVYSVIPILKTLPVPGEVYKMIPYLATLVVLAFSSRNLQAPRAAGIPYDKGRR